MKGTNGRCSTRYTIEYPQRKANRTPQLAHACWEGFRVPAWTGPSLASLEDGQFDEELDAMRPCLDLQPH